MNKNTYKLVCFDFLVHGFDDSGKKKKKKGKFRLSIINVQC